MIKLKKLVKEQTSPGGGQLAPAKRVNPELAAKPTDDQTSQSLIDAYSELIDINKSIYDVHMAIAGERITDFVKLHKLTGQQINDNDINTLADAIRIVKGNVQDMWDSWDEPGNNLNKGVEPKRSLERMPPIKDPEWLQNIKDKAGV